MFKKIWKSFWNAVLHFGPVQWLIAGLGALFIWLLYFTCRVSVDNYEVFKKYRRAPAIFTFWHGRMLMLSPVVCMGGMRSYVIASRHSDGRLMARIEKLFGLDALYGSSTRGGAAVLREGVNALLRGDKSICLSPDGPSGPSMRMHSGALYFAQQSGAPIIPVTFSASRAHFLKRWDYFMIPMPFSRVVVRLGNPIFVPREMNDQEFQNKLKQVEDVMIKLTCDLDAEFNLPPCEQGLRLWPYKNKMRAERAAKKAARRARYKNFCKGKK